MKQALPAEAIRFLISGGLNTALTYVVYLALLPPAGYAVAYTVAYVAGIALAYFLSTRFVFRVEGSARRAAAFPLIYLVQYLFGLAVLHASVAWLSIPQQFAVLISIALSVPLTFLLSRFVLVAGRGRGGSES
ncbi:GtrA family protein [Tahibacter sp. UC22_41]|uniref:GtrA family protein n=1 Tax=Tahibacter sp. UC22_41 TaxID=3350178 RepID=UPI0036DB96C2